MTEATERKYVIEVTGEGMDFIKAGLVALRRDLRTEAGSDLVMAHVIETDGIGEASETVKRAEKAILLSNKVSALLDHLVMKG